MKLLLVNDQGESVACLEDVEVYDVQNSSNVLALLDFLETLIAAAKAKPGSSPPGHGPVLVSEGMHT
jgi:hypothetical protein